MAIYSMNNNRFAGPKSDTPWKPSPAMKMRQAAAADRVQTSAKQDALDFKSDAANAGLRQRVEAATLRQQLAGLNQQQRTLGRNLPLSSGPTTNTAPRPTTLGLPQGVFESSQPVRAGLASRNALNAPSTGGSTARQPTTPPRTKRPPRPGRGGQASSGAGTGSKGSSNSPSAPMKPMGEKFGRATGANPDYRPGGQASIAPGGVGGRTSGTAQLGRGPGIGALGGGSGGSRASGGTRGASSALPKPVLGGADRVTAPGGVLGRTWAGDDKARNNRPSDLAAVGTVGNLAGRTGTINVHSSREGAGRSNTLGYNSRGESTTSSGPGPDRLPGTQGGGQGQPGFDKDAWKKRNRNRGSSGSSSGSRGGSSSK